MGNRCSICSITYPTIEKKCRVCGRATWHAENLDPDENWEAEVESAIIRAELDDRPLENNIRTDKVWRYRRDKFFEIGFTLRQADVLASIRRPDGVFLYWHEVKRRFLEPADPLTSVHLDLIFEFLTANTGELAASREALPA